MKPYKEYINNLRNFAKSYRGPLILYAATFLALFCVILILDISANCVGSNIAMCIARIIGDVAFILLPFWLIGRRWRWTILIPLYLITIFVIANIWYYRFWEVILPLSFMTMTSNVDELLLNSILGLVSIYDILIFLPAISITIYYVRCRKRIKQSRKFTKKIKGIATALSVLVYITVQIGLSLKVMHYHQKGNFDDNSNATFWGVTTGRLSTLTDTSHYYTTNGLVATFVSCLYATYQSMTIEIELTPDQRRSIDEFISSQNINYVSSNNTLVANNQKNVIFIIVESLNAEVINKKYGDIEVTPNMNNLVAASGTISSLQMRNQIVEGGSSDGQLIYNSGILPLKSGASSILVTPKCTFEGIVSALNRHGNIAIFADAGNSWNQEPCFHQFGFSQTFASRNFADKLNVRGADGAMFDFGLQLIDTLPQPFFAEFVTISMHVPFKDKGMPDKFNYDFQKFGCDPQEEDYLRVTSYFDAELGAFIEALKQKGIWDNTILILASDHSQNIAVSKKRRLDDNNMSIVFIAANTGQSKQIMQSVDQIDVFPTILKICGVEHPTFAGMGVSLLDSTQNSSNNFEAKQEISELILRGNYFDCPPK